MLDTSKKLQIAAISFITAFGAILYQYPSLIKTFLQFIAGVIIFIAILWCIYQTLEILDVFSGPVDRKKRSIENSVSNLDKYRETTYPQFPTGWYPLCWSHEVKKGQVIQVNALGKHYAVFRGDKNGEIGVLDAFCPHLGSNLTVGGKVCNDQLQCPFHRWKFDQNGVCKDIPYLNKKSKIPNNANAKSYQFIEYHDQICVYYNANETHSAKGNETITKCAVSTPSIPLYNLPIQHDILNKNEYRLAGEYDYGLVKMHIQEFAENAADWMHFSPIHGKMMFPFTRYEIPIIGRWLSIHHEPDTHIGGGVNKKDSMAIQSNNYGPDNKYFLYFINRSHLKWNGKSIPKSDGNAAITFCGPAGICIFRMSIPSFDPEAQIILFHTHLPEDKMNLRVRFHWYAHRKLPKLLVWYVVGNWISQWTNDIDIWENKILLKKPCLVRGDGPIFKVRRWWRQFYPKEEEDKKKIVINDEDDNDSKQEEISLENKSKVIDQTVNDKGDGTEW